MATRRPDTFMVFFGGEDYFLDQAIEKARTWKDRKVIMLSGEDIDEREFVGIADTNTFDGMPRVLILDDAQKLKGDKALKTYIEGRTANDGGPIIVVIVRSEKCPAVWNEAAKKGRLTEHKKLKTWDSNNEVIKWIEGEAKRLGLLLEPNMSQILFQYVGPNLYRLSNELSKLKLLVGDNGKVGLEQVTLVIAKSQTAEPFQVAEAAMAKDSRRAMNNLSVVYRLMGDDAHVPVTFSLIRQVEKFVLARSLLDKKSPEDEIALALDMNVWRFKNQFLPLVQRHQMPDLIRHMGRLRKLDVDVKSSARSKRTLVELAVMSIAT